MANDQCEEFESGTGRTGGIGPKDILERILLVGLGAAAITVDRVQAVVDEFVRRGQLSVEEGRQMVESLTARSRTEARSTFQHIDSSFQGACRELGIATRREVEDLEFRIQQLEHRLGLVEGQLDDLTATEAEDEEV